MGKFDGMTVREILALKKASIRAAPLPPGSPAWDSLFDFTWEQVTTAARQNIPGFKTIRKLLSDQRFDR